MTGDHITRGSIIVGVDGSDHAERAVLWAAEQAALEKHRLVVLRADEVLTSSRVHAVARVTTSAPDGASRQNAARHQRAPKLQPPVRPLTPRSRSNRGTRHLRGDDPDLARLAGVVCTIPLRNRNHVPCFP
ncbi:universal stress protein [Nocardioides szechwanensis]|uniref:universal stress protein n=1 Tax=Nocardioides szechwanensis TaxID=1005944 RepID=UPI000B89584E